MANHVSALKRMRMTERRTAVNRNRKSRLRTEVKKMRTLIASKNADAAKAAVPEAFSIIDRAAKWGVIKKNSAARYKARIARRVGALSAPAA